MHPLRAEPRISFLAFFLLWAERMRWEVPPLHVRVCLWLQRAWVNGSQLMLLMLPRGHAKSTILEIFNAWIYYCAGDHLLRILHQSESNPTARKTSRGTQNVLRYHPLTQGMVPEDSAIEQWWVAGMFEIDPRNASMYARGILSNVTSARADFVQNDDIEVPSNINSPEKREKLRFRLGEQVHIAVPDAPTLYVGTPHTHESIYDEVRALGADAMIVRMFEKEYRIKECNDERYDVGFVPEWVFSGIGKGARLLIKNVDYKLEGTVIVFASPGGELVDCYAEAAWPERFTAKEMQRRRQKTRTINEWDSQYQLHSKPVTQSRLDPKRILAYDVMPRFHYANNASSMWLGKVQIVGASCRWDPSGGKLRSDASAVGVVLQDEVGRRYLQAVAQLKGEVAKFDDDGKTIIGGQVFELCQIIELYSLPRVSVETNGIGGFAPAVLRACIKQWRTKSGAPLRCAVVETHSSENKNKRILETFEPLLLSRGMIWAHVDVLRGPFAEQMRDWDPVVTVQADDFLDCTSGAITETPERFRAPEPPTATKGGIPMPGRSDDWRPGGGEFTATFER